MENKSKESNVKACIESVVFNIEKIATKHAIYLQDVEKLESMYIGETLVKERKTVVNAYIHELNMACALIKENLNKIEECLEQEDYVDITAPAFNNAVNILSSARNLSPETVDSIVKNFAGKNKELEIMGDLINPAYKPIIEGYMYNHHREFTRMRNIADMLSLNPDSPYEITNVRVELRKIATVYGINWEDKESVDYHNFRMRNIASLIGVSIN